MLGAVIARHTAHVARHATYTPARMPKRLPRARTLKGDPKIAYYDSGGGVAGEPAVVLAPASPFRSEGWGDIFSRLAPPYRGSAVDQRGHGKSGRASGYSVRAR